MFDLGVISAKNHQPFNLSDRCSGRLSGYSSYDARVLRTAENYGNFRTWSGQLVTQGKMVDDGGDESGFCSPPLWRTSPTSSPPHRKHNHYRSLSPESKAQAIARGQRELMEMVSKMPESCYELSLKDLVEQQPGMNLKQESFREEKEVKREKGVKRDEKRKEIMKRNESLSRSNEGLLLKMVFPVGFGTKKKKKKNDLVSNNNYSSKVSPKSPIPEGSDNNKAVDKEWWKKRFSVQGETDQSSAESGSSNNGSGKSTVSTNSSDSISRSSSRHENGGGCWSFIRIQRRKNME